MDIRYYILVYIGWLIAAYNLYITLP